MRIRTILAAAAVPAALAASLLGTAGAASAAPLPSVATVANQTQLDNLVVNGAINQNINITAPASENVWLGWTTVKNSTPKMSSDAASPASATRQLPVTKTICYPLVH